MKYKEGQKLNVSMRTGFHNSEVADREVVVDRIDELTGLITIKYDLESSGFRRMFGTESDLDKLAEWYKERHGSLDDKILDGKIRADKKGNVVNMDRGR